MAPDVPGRAESVHQAAQALLDEIETLRECPFCGRRTEHYNGAKGRPCLVPALRAALAADAADTGHSDHGAPAAITATYTNWRGETAERRIIPRRVWYGETQWHEPQWLLDAYDVDKQAERSFSLGGFDVDTVIALGASPQVTREQVADLAAEAEDWLSSLPRLYPDDPDGWAGEYSIDPRLVKRLVALLGAPPAGEVLWEGSEDV